MFLEITIAICLLIGLAVTIKRLVRREKNWGTPIGVALVISLAIIAFYAYVLCIVNDIPIANLDPIESQPLEQLNDYYAFKSNDGNCYFMYDGKILGSKNYHLVSINTTTLTEPTVYKCNLKHDWLIPLLFKNSYTYFVIVAPEEMIKIDSPQEQSAPDWL